METVNILVAEDDENIRIGLMDTLESEGYRVEGAGDGDAALAMFRTGGFDLVILDIMMPGLSGYDVCRAIRKENETIPIIMLTAKGEEIDKVVGLQLGADDYVTKPFGVHEFLARVAAVLRRSLKNRESVAESNDSDRFFIGDAEVDAREYRVRKDGETRNLSERELRLLQFFHAHPDEVLSRDALLNGVWGIDYFGTTRTLDQHVARIRKKIETDPARPTIITTVHGVGYRYSNA
ncbi:MAG: response regulator transcription factor [Desulfobacterales bacterium]|nr:response regulator transcription factor [Desulfobacterales bacterium]